MLQILLLKETFINIKQRGGGGWTKTFLPFFIAKFGRFMHRFNFLLVQTNNVIEKKTWLNPSPPSFACRGEICGVGWSDIALLVVFRSDIFLWVQIKKISFFWCACTIALLTRGKVFIDKMNNFLRKIANIVILQNFKEQSPKRKLEFSLV